MDVYIQFVKLFLVNLLLFFGEGKQSNETPGGNIEITVGGKGLYVEGGGGLKREV